MEKIETKLIRIGNSQGIRIPKHILKRLNIHNKIELIIDEQNKQLSIKSSEPPRKDWEKAFQKMHQLKEDELIIDDAIDLELWDW